MFVIFDLDGTLADITHRLHLIKREQGHKDWDQFFALCGADKLIEPVAHVYEAMIQSGHRVEVWSGRSDQCRAETELWFRSRGLSAPALLRMRCQGDYTPDHLLKESWIDWDRLPDLVFDDRQRVVDMWRNNGLRCAQVAQWDE